MRDREVEAYNAGYKQGVDDGESSTRKEILIRIRATLARVSPTDICLEDRIRRVTLSDMIHEIEGLR